MAHLINLKLSKTERVRMQERMQYKYLSHVLKCIRSRIRSRAFLMDRQILCIRSRSDWLRQVT